MTRGRTLLLAAVALVVALVLLAIVFPWVDGWLRDPTIRPR